MRTACVTAIADFVRWVELTCSGLPLTCRYVTYLPRSLNRYIQRFRFWAIFDCA